MSALEPKPKLWQQLKKYASIYQAFFRASFISDLEFRSNFILRFATDIFWYMAQILTFEVLFLHTEKIGDWNRAQTRVFLGVLFIIDAIYMITISENLDRMSEKVRKGDLDLVLAKPINSQFMISLQKVNTAIFGNLILGLIWFFYSLSQLPDFSWFRLLWMIVMVPCGVAVIYALRFSFSSIAVIFAKSENVQFLWFQLYKLAMRPNSIYFPWLKFILLTLLPVGMIASVPAEVLMDPHNIWLPLWALILAPTVIYLSHRFWHFCLKFYGSASS